MVSSSGKVCPILHTGSDCSATAGSWQVPTVPSRLCFWKCRCQMLRSEKRRSGGPCDVWCVRISASGALTHRCRICKRLKKAPTFWNTVSPYLPLWIQSCQKIATCLFATYSNPPKFSLDALTTLASKHLTICEQSIVFCEAKLPLLMGNYVLEATDTMQMAFVPWFSRSMAVNSGKAFHTYDICQSALRLPRFEREREREIERTWCVSEYVEMLWICGVVVQVRVTSLENGTSQACHGLTRPFQVRVGSYWLVQTVECLQICRIYILHFAPFAYRMLYNL